MDKRKKSLLIGLCIGDGHLNGRSGVALEIEHGEKQKFYIEYKAKLISKLLNCAEPNMYNNKRKSTYKISKGHKYFKIIRKWLYKDNKKVITRALLNKLSPEALAIWWMDDGTHGVDRHKITGRIRSHSFALATFMDDESTQNIIDYFNEVHNIKFYPINRTLKDGTKSSYLRCRTREGRKLSALLRPYMLPEFLYKIMGPDE